MSASKRYLLDAIVYIEAHQRYYAFDICPGFWQAIVRQAASGRVCSIDKVRRQLVRARTAVDEDDPQQDGLSEWVESHAPAELFKGTADARVAGAVADIVKWVQNDPRFRPDAKAAFAGDADVGSLHTQRLTSFCWSRTKRLPRRLDWSNSLMFADVLT